MYYIACSAQFLSVKKSGTANQLPILALNEEPVCQYDALTADKKNFFLLESLRCFRVWDEAFDVFYMDGSRRSFGGEQYFDPHFDEFDGGIPTSIFQLGELGLHVGKELLYRFDFGAGWEFTILVLDIEPGATAGKKFKLLKSVGKAPKQYDGW